MLFPPLYEDISFLLLFLFYHFSSVRYPSFSFSPPVPVHFPFVHTRSSSLPSWHNGSLIIPFNRPSSGERERPSRILLQVPLSRASTRHLRFINSFSWSSLQLCSRVFIFRFLFLLFPGTCACRCACYHDSSKDPSSFLIRHVAN